MPDVRPWRSREHVALVGRWPLGTTVWRWTRRSSRTCRRSPVVESIGGQCRKRSRPLRRSDERRPRVRDGVRAADGDRRRQGVQVFKDHEDSFNARSTLQNWSNGGAPRGAAAPEVDARGQAFYKRRRWPGVGRGWGCPALALAWACRERLGARFGYRQDRHDLHWHAALCPKRSRRSRKAEPAHLITGRPTPPTEVEPLNSASRTDCAFFECAIRELALS